MYFFYPSQQLQLGHHHTTVMGIHHFLSKAKGVALLAYLATTQELTLVKTIIAWEDWEANMALQESKVISPYSTNDGHWLIHFFFPQSGSNTGGGTC